MLHEQIQNDIKEAMKAKDEVRLSVLRGLKSSMTNEVVSLGKKPDEKLGDDEAMAVIKRASKQRKDSIQQFTDGGRPELAETEQAELKIIEEYLPTQMSDEEIKKIAEAKKSEMGVTDKADIGKLTGAVMKEAKGQADGNKVKEIIESLF